MGRQLPRPNELEVLASSMLGPDADAKPLPRPTGRGVRTALDTVLVDALSRQPCVVSFSGGRDSSAILALAIDAARRHGLPHPTPVMMRFSEAPDTEETAWQELVLEHLGVTSLNALQLRYELDVLGPAATDVLRQHGLIWPSNAYMHRPICEAAQGGTVLTGVGGDELFGTRSPRRRPRQFMRDSLPKRARESIWLRNNASGSYGWLTQAGRDRVYRGLAREEIRCPYRWDGALRYWYASRAYGASVGSLALIAADFDATVVSPLMDPQVLAELSVVAGRRGFPSRTHAMRWLCGDLLPERAISRPTKASFSGALWGSAVRDFVADWDGSGVDPRHVDVEQLKREAQRSAPDFRTTLLVQQAWLHGI